MSNIIDSIQLSGVTYTLQGSGGGGTVSSAITSGDTNAVAGGAVYDKFDEVEQVTARALNDLDEKINPTVELTQAEYDALVSAGTVDPNTFYVITDATAFDPSTKVDTSAFTAYSAATNAALNGKVNTSSVVSSVTSASTDSEIPTAKAVWEAASGGGKAIEAGRGIAITTGETADTITFSLPISADTNNNFIYGSTTNTVDNNSVVNYNTLIGIGNTITHTGSLVPRMYENIIYGERNTISFKGALSSEIVNNLILGFNNNISGDYGYYRGYGRYNIVCGYSNGLNKSSCSFVHGWVNSSNGDYQFLNGYYLQANNNYETTFGQYNVSNSATTTYGDSGNTLFSVGNGTSSSARHNAFEIRQNGDIYLSLNGQDVKLQDQLGGSSITVDTALDSGSTNPVENRVIYDKIDEIEQVTAAGLNALNDNFGGLKLVKLTQAEYNALTTKDSSTLYIIVN